MLEPGIPEPVQHGPRERLRRLGGKVRRGDDLREQDVPQEGAESRMLGRLADRTHACQERERRRHAVRPVQEAQLALPVEGNVRGEDHGLRGHVDRKRAAQRLRVGFDRPEAMRLGHREERVGVTEAPLERRARVRRRRARRDPVHQRGAEPDAPREPVAELGPSLQPVREATDHRREALPVGIHELGRDHEERGPVGEPLEARVQEVREFGRKPRVRPEARFRHVADDRLQLGPRNHLAHRRPLRIRDERARDRAHEARPLDRRSVLEPPLEQGEQTVLGVDDVRPAMRRALHDHDASVERTGAVRLVHARRTHGAQQHPRSELKHPLRKLRPRVGAPRPVLVAQPREVGGEHCGKLRAVSCGRNAPRRRVTLARPPG